MKLTSQIGYKMFEVTMSSFKLKDDKKNTYATGPRQLTKAFYDVPGKVIVIGINMAISKVTNYYNHHIDNGVLIGMGKNEIVDVASNLLEDNHTDCVMIIARTNDWLNNAECITIFEPELKPYVVDEINQVNDRARSMMCDDDSCCSPDGWEIN